MSETNLEEQKPYEFQPDPAIKKFLTELSTPKLIGIINACCKTDYPLDSQVDFGKTEYFTVLGDLDKNSVRGDLVANIQSENSHETTNKIIIELQSTKDNTMGFRMFVYSLNVSDEENKVYKFPKGVTIYTTLDMPKEGMDEVNLQIEQFRVGSHQFSAENGDLLTVEFPYVNLLAMDFEEFQNAPLEPLKIIYPYRYRKDPSLMKRDTNFKEILEDVRDYTVNQEGSDRIAVSGLVCEIVVDLVELCKKNPDNFSEELEIMEHLNKSSTQILVDEVNSSAEARGEARGETKKSLEIAKNLLDVLDTAMIAAKTGLSLDQIESLRTN